jgi:hypothetical protein
MLGSQVTWAQACQAVLCVGPGVGRGINATSRIQLVIFGLQNRTLGPYLAAINGNLVSVMRDPSMESLRDPPPSLVSRRSMKPCSSKFPILHAK